MAALVTADITLDDKYALDRGRVYLTGTQALVRLLLMQRRRDTAAGLHTAGYVSGYRGSPLGSVDKELWRASAWLERHHVRFQPGVNEDLAATAIWGTQQASLDPKARYDGVFALWYGKGPGVDRSGDVFRHANLAGTSRFGGVLAVAGDDPGCTSSTVPSSSEHAFIDARIPVLDPAGVADVLDFGLQGFAMSRASGCWVALKSTAETIDCAASVAVDVDRPRLILSPSADDAASSVHIRGHDWPPVAAERRLIEVKLPAVQDFARANGIDRVIRGDASRRFGIVTRGKVFLEVLQALQSLGLDAATCDRVGLAVYKVGLVWPLEPAGLLAFVDGLEEVLVVEEKRPVLEQQIKDLLYHCAADRRPLVTGKTDAAGARLLPAWGALDADTVARVIASRLAGRADMPAAAAYLARLDAVDREQNGRPPVLSRLPYFCSGCPHNTSTRVPAGSRAVAGIGCHFMVTWMDRSSDTFTQMGGEGANWLGMAPFVDRPHMFVNIGDGTYFHSGLLAVRAAVAAGANITFKILYNDAVAMTGGQPVDGPLDVAMITRQVAAEGVRRIAVVAEEPGTHSARGGLAPGATVHGRDALDAVQRQLRSVPGPSVLIYDQTCAAEKRRRRKRGTLVDQARRVVINPWVCEGCGDCGVRSNCVSIVPLETEFGRKRAIDQSSCNKDLSCLEGFCPSFVTVEGVALQRDAVPLPAAPAEPETVPLDAPWGLVIAGIGGSGVVTLGAIVGMAAHLEGKAVSVLDQVGLAQKNGAVVGHVRIADQPAALTSARLATGGADLLIGCDLVTAAGDDVLRLLTRERSRGVVDSHPVMTAHFTHDPDLAFPETALRRRLAAACGDGRVELLDISLLAVALTGEAAAANLMLLGYACQAGLLPVRADSIERAIILNGVAVDANRRAFLWGRRAAVDRGEVMRAAGLEEPAPAAIADVDGLVNGRAEELAAYGGPALARRYRALVDAVRAREKAVTPGSDALAAAVARAYFKVLACKDEYEVARLFTDGRFEAMLGRQVEGRPRLAFHLAPPLLARRDPATGHLKKRTYGAWTLTVFRMLKRLRFLRGTPFDPFGHSAERRAERQAIVDYEATVEAVLAGLRRDNHGLACSIAALPETVRGFGHVKAANAAVAAARRDELMVSFHRPPAAADAA
jgi:indolepyruvate ferredoxin oxidoreductase